MKIVKTTIPDVLLFEPKVFGDERGFFMETFRQSIFSDLNIDVNFVQDNHSASCKNVLRGLHYQIKHPQGKLVRVTMGEIYDVAVDLRKSSATFGHHIGVNLSASNKRMLWVPPGFAHGFLVLSEQAEFIYKCTDYYKPEYERSLLWSDPTLAINWPLEHGQKPGLSEKDFSGSLFADAEIFFVKVVVTGVSGQLGCSLLDTVPEAIDVIGLSRLAIDFSSLGSIQNALSEAKPDAVINAAAYTAVDAAESDSSLAFSVNAEAVKELACYCGAEDIPLIQVSTDFVFDGNKSSPYQPLDETNPLGVYGHSKLQGERYAAEFCSQSYIVRTGWLYSEYGNNFVKTMLRLAKEREHLGVVADQVGSPTYALNLAKMIWCLLAKLPDSQVFHYSDAGIASWYDLSIMAFYFAKKHGLLSVIPDVKPLATADYPTAAIRPSYSVLDKQLTWNKLGFEPIHWHYSLNEMIENFKKLES